MSINTSEEREDRYRSYRKGGKSNELAPGDRNQEQERRQGNRACNAWMVRWSQPGRREGSSALCVNMSLELGLVGLEETRAAGTTWPFRRATWPALPLRRLPRPRGLRLLCPPLINHQHESNNDNLVERSRERLNLHSDFPASGNRSNCVLTGTGPVLSIRSSIASCSIPSSSCSSSSSSGCSPSGT